MSGCNEKRCPSIFSIIFIAIWETATVALLMSEGGYLWSHPDPNLKPSQQSDQKVGGLILILISLVGLIDVAIWISANRNEDRYVLKVHLVMSFPFLLIATIYCIMMGTISSIVLVILYWLRPLIIIILPNPTLLRLSDDDNSNVYMEI